MNIIPTPARLLLLLAVVVYSAGCGILSSAPSKPKHEVKETYRLGWWSKNANLTIEKFDVALKESKLNLFNPESKITYTIEGTMKSNEGWEPYISNVHVSERMAENDSGKVVPVLEFTPIMSSKKNKKHKAGVYRFSITNEHLIHSYKWGSNEHVFLCGGIRKTLKTDQKK